VALRPGAGAREHPDPPAAVAGDQIGDERSGHERTGRGPDRLADGGAARRLLARGLSECRRGVREHGEHEASSCNPGAAHVLSSLVV
jgi:hypothetical protein